MTSYAHQYLYLSSGQDATPNEIVNGSRLAANLANAGVCSLFNDPLANMGCAGYAYAPTMPAALLDPVLWLDALDGTPSRQIAPNRGTGGPNLNGTLGPGTAIGTDEPTWLGGSENYAYFPGVTGNAVTLPDTASLRVAGDLDIMVRLAMDNWAPSTSRILSKFTSTSNGYQLGITGSGLQLNVVVAGADVTVNSTTGPTFAVQQAAWIRVTRVAATGVVTFYTAPDSPAPPVAWAQLGTAVTSTAGAIATGNSVMTLGAASGGGALQPMAGKVFRAIVRGVIDASTPVNVLDVDFTVGLTTSLLSQTSFVAVAGGTATFVRANTGRKTVAYVGRPLWLFGLDDYILIPDNNLLDFDANESFTVLAMVRQFGIAVPESGSLPLVSKQATFPTSAGWSLYTRSGGSAAFVVSDGAANVQQVSATLRADGVLNSVIGVRNATSKQVITYLNGSSGGSTGVDPTTTTSANATPVRIASNAGAAYSNAEVYAVLVWRRALSQAEITAVSNYLTATTSLAGKCWTQIDVSTLSASPWYDSRLPESAEALGFFIEDWTGLDGAHHTRSSTPTGINRGGALYGPQTHNPRVWKMNVLLHGSTERGLNFLFRWLEAQLINCCGSPCGEEFAWYREVCPTDPTNSPDEGLRRAERVALLEGPTWETEPIENAGCYLRRVSFTLGCGDPCLYTEPAPVALSEVTASGTGTGNQPTNCGTFSDPRRTLVRMNGPVGFGSTAPIITISSPAQNSAGVVSGLPALRIVGYLDPTSHADPCRAVQIGELILEGAYTSGWEIVVDMVKRIVRKRPVGTQTWLDGSGLIGAPLRSGLRRWWSFAPCDQGIVVVEPAFTHLESFRSGTQNPIVSTWTVKIEQASRVGCC